MSEVTRPRSLFRRSVVAALMALVFVALLAGPAWAVRKISITPEKGPKGTEITVTGSGFKANHDVEIRSSGLDKIKTVKTDASGGFTTTITANGDHSGTYTIQAVETGHGNEAEAKSNATTFTQTKKAKAISAIEATSQSQTNKVVGDEVTGIVDGKAFRISGGTMTVLPTAGGSTARGFDVNKGWVVVGDSLEQGDQTSHAVSWNTDGTITDWGAPLGGTNSGLFGIDDKGYMAGWSYLQGNSAFHAMAIANGQAQDLGTLGGTNSVATDINNLGQTVGASEYTNGSMDDHAFVGAFSGPPRRTAESPASAATYTMKDLGTLGGATSVAVSISNKGVIVGQSNPKGSMNNHAFRYAKGTMKDLGTLGGPQSNAQDVNDWGQVVGSAQIAGGGYHAFLWTRGHMIDLNMYLPKGSGWVLTGAFGISNKNVIVGQGNFGGKMLGFVMHLA